MGLPKENILILETLLQIWISALAPNGDRTMPATVTVRQQTGDGQAACPPEKQRFFFNSRSRTGMKQFSGGQGTASRSRCVAHPTPPGAGQRRCTGRRRSRLCRRSAHCLLRTRGALHLQGRAVVVPSAGLTARGTPAGCGSRCLLIVNHWLFHLGCFSFDLSKSRINKFSEYVK